MLLAFFTYKLHSLPSQIANTGQKLYLELPFQHELWRDTWMESWGWDTPRIFAGDTRLALAILHHCRLRCYEQVNDGSGEIVVFSSSGVKFD